MILEIRKSECPIECVLREKWISIPAVAIPYPKKIRAVIVSRDPPLPWRVDYDRAFSLDNDHERIRHELHEAIPGLLARRIESFIDVEEENNHFIVNRQLKIKKLRTLLIDHSYWTHFHKCFTDVTQKESAKFKVENGKLCANRWLNQELDSLNYDEMECLICLGDQVSSWICQWKEDFCKKKEIKVFYLPHPSPANVGVGFSWKTKRSPEKEILRSRVTKLIDLADDLVH